MRVDERPTHPADPPLVTSVSRPDGGGGGGRYRNENARKTAADVIVGKKTKKITIRFSDRSTDKSCTRTIS